MVVAPRSLIWYHNDSDDEDLSERVVMIASKDSVVEFAERPGVPGLWPGAGLILLLVLLACANSASAAISIEGVADRTVYADTVSFRINAEAGFDYTAELNGQTIATDEWIQINEPEYYELNVYRQEQPSGDQESRLVRFIVRASERGNTEWGLPVWTPYPMTDSAANEFDNANLKIIAPENYPMNLDIPIVARLEDGSGKRLGVNGVIAPDGFEHYPLQIIRGVGSVFLPGASEQGLLTYMARVNSLQKQKQINIEQATTWQIVSDDISISTDWPENARIRINVPPDDPMTIEAGAALTIGAGSVIVIDPGVEISVRGAVIVNGTQQQPVIFTAANRTQPWGGFVLPSSSSRGIITGAIFTASGDDPDYFTHDYSHRTEQALFNLAGGAELTLTDCYIVDNQGQAGHGENASLTMTGCLVQKCTTAGQYNGGSVAFEDCALIECPSATAEFVDGDNDAIYLTTGTHTFRNCLIGWTLDDGIDAGASAAGVVTVSGCWFESCYHEAMAWSGPKMAEVNETVILNCGQGIECGYSGPDVNATHCLSTANLVGARLGDNAARSYAGNFLKVTDSLLLFNHRNVWGMAWDNWTEHVSQMEIRDNCLSTPNPYYPENQIWNPTGNPAHPNELEPFLATASRKVGIALATADKIYPLADFSDKIPVRLSTFTTGMVSVDYDVFVNADLFDSGCLQFPPGETVKHIQVTSLPTEGIQQIRVELTEPTGAELTNCRRIRFMDSPWPGDFEPDGDVDFCDFAVLSEAWLTREWQADYNPVCDISVPPNGAIDIQDLMIFADNWLAGY
ncbi:MAG: hypothetical protein JW720_06650 [Sedimentisphaerales bacterium]|nr:hypothetical protein [Sedimentisphaerales bacterium]